MLLVLTALIFGALASVSVLGVQFALAKDLTLELRVDGSELFMLAYLALFPLLTALLYHPDTRSEFGLPETGKSPWVLYLGAARSSGVLAAGLAMAAFLIGPHLLTNPLATIASAIRNDAGVAREIGKVESLGLLALGESNWIFGTEIRAKGSEGTGFYYADLDADGKLTLDGYAYEGLQHDLVFIPRVQEEPAVPEAVADESTPGEVVTLLSTSFETAGGAAMTPVWPLVQVGQLPWARDRRARSGRSAANAIPDGNPGVLSYFNKSVSPVLLSSRPGDRYAPFRVEPFRRVELEFWRLSRSNPSTRHNCLGSLQVEYRFDGGEWQSKMVFCGKHKSAPLMWQRSLLEFDTKGRQELEIRFDYEYPPEVRKDKTAVYLIDDLEVRGYR